MANRTFAAAACLVLLAACGGGHEHGAGAADGHDHSHDHPAMGSSGAVSFSFGAPGDPSSADRTVEITAEDPYRFDPEELDLAAGETVTFVVTNEGDQEHEFVLGDDDYQVSHGEAMAGGAMHHEGNAVTVAPGATEELTWTFPASGEVLYACHVAGHYDGGMVGVIRLES